MFTKIKHIFELVKFSHSIFALPFALSALFYAEHGFPTLKKLFLIVICMVTARNTAMAFNRLVDAKSDAENPRTAIRHIPQGLLSKNTVTLFIIVNALIFMFTASFFNQLTLFLAPVALLIICGYSYTKRFTHGAQIFLGLSLGIAPASVWIAVTGTLTFFPILMGLGVLFWVAGFDILYATQDYEFDKSKNLKSLVVLCGIPRALILSRIFHLLSILFFTLTGLYGSLSSIYFTAVFLIACGLFYEHSLVKKDDLSRINIAFFTINGLIGMIYFIGSLLDIFF